MTRRRGRGRKAEERLRALFLDAEKRGGCLYPTSEKDARILRRRAAEEESELVQPAAGLYARKAYWGNLKPDAKALHIMRGLSAMHPNWVFSAQSAALAHGFPMSYSTLSKTHVAVHSGHRQGRHDKIVRHAVSHDEPAIASGMRVTSFWRTVFDCLTTLEFSEALLVADHALRTRRISRAAMRRALLRRFSGHRGIGRALDICAWAEPCAESGGESIARAGMIRLGFALPRLQVELPDPIDPTRSFRVDYVWRDESRALIFGELDGGAKYTEKELTGEKSLDEVLGAEHERQTRLSVYRARLIRFSFDEARNLAALERKLATYGVPRGARPRLRSGIPTPPDDAWERITYLAQGTKVLLGQRIRFTQEAA